ncbi:MAG: BMP family ABC transporter substrate-binding protein [Hyphomicrobiales bacterium]|nr:BMP family ABC transporter substrate-binding protein [Hyphomicrobiales bacterium]
MTKQHNRTRRQILIGSGSLMAAGSFLAAAPRPVFATPMTVGFIYEGSKDDFGWNQSHAVGARKIAKETGAKLVEQEKVPETADVERVMESMIQLDGAQVLFPTSFGYWPFILKLAAKYPKVLFVHAGGLWKQGDPANVISYRGYMEEPHYCCGVAAGMMTKTNKIGFVGPKPLYFIFNNCNGFTLGARSVNPKVTSLIIITGDWANPVKDADAVNNLVDQGCDVIISDSDAPKVSIETAERRGVHSCGYHTDLSSLAPKGFVTGAEWNWAKGADFVKAWQTGGKYPNLLIGGFKQDLVAISPFGGSVPDAVKSAVLKARDGFTNDTLKLYHGPLKDNEGHLVLKEGEVIANDDSAFKTKVNFLVEGTQGQTGLKKQ